jgi:putative proteasome-type protease
LHLRVVPANAGTHTPYRVFLEAPFDRFRATLTPVIMGPGVRRDDILIGWTPPAKLASNFRAVSRMIRKSGNRFSEKIMRKQKRIGDAEMTYCCGVLVRDGLVMIADTRTNAGLDNVSTFRKLHIFSKPGERIMAIASAGNLAISQSVLSTLTEGLEDPHTGDLETLLNAPTMFQAAQRIGKAIRAVQATEGTALQSEDINFDVSFLFGGQIKGSRMRLFMVYPAGNFIECTTDTPYLQIGEHKYGKPVLDRAMHYDVELYEALKTSLISMDSTMRSNLGVGLPIDVLVVRTDVCDADLNHRIEAGEPYFHDLRSRWSAALRAAHQNIPRPPYKTETPKT